MLSMREKKRWYDLIMLLYLIHNNGKWNVWILNMTGENFASIRFSTFFLEQVEFNLAEHETDSFFSVLRVDGAQFLSLPILQCIQQIRSLLIKRPY